MPGEAQPVSSPNIHLPGPLASLKRTTGENGQAPLSGPTRPVPGPLSTGAL